MKNTPSGAAFDYLAAASEGSLRGMRRASQRSYELQYAGLPPSRRPATHHPLREHLVRFKVIEAVPVSDVMVDVHVHLWVRSEGGKANDLGIFRIRTICEDKEGSPTPTGRWGVNPASLRTVPEATPESKAS